MLCLYFLLTTTFSPGGGEREDGESQEASATYKALENQELQAPQGPCFKALNTGRGDLLTGQAARESSKSVGFGCVAHARVGFGNAAAHPLFCNSH